MKPKYNWKRYLDKNEQFDLEALEYKIKLCQAGPLRDLLRFREQRRILQCRASTRARRKSA